MFGLYEDFSDICGQFYPGSYPPGAIEFNSLPRSQCNVTQVHLPIRTNPNESLRLPGDCPKFLDELP